MAYVDQNQPLPSSRQGHSLRRDNMSVSSTHSAAGSSRGGERAGRGSPAVESAVTRLLVAIKQLLEALTRWSNTQIKEDQVSDVYVRLGNDFNAAVAAFQSFEIDMTELLSVPQDLRVVLEQCLAEDATPENLEIYLPTVRQIITGLLQGLRKKQSQYRKIMQETRQRSDSTRHDRTDSRSSRSSRKAGDGAMIGHRSQLSRTISETGSFQDMDSSLRSPPVVSSNLPQSPTVAEGADNFVGGFVAPGSNGFSAESVWPRDTSVGPSESVRKPASMQPPPRSDSLEDVASLRRATPTPPTEHTRQRSYSPVVSVPPLPSSPPPTIVQPHVPSSVKRYSLVDKPMPMPPSVIVDGVEENRLSDGTLQPPSISPPPETTTPSDTTVSQETPAVANSLAALKRSEALERRASKRFSTYNISKMTGSASRDRSLRGQNRRSLLAAGSALTPGELAVLTEADDEDAPSTLPEPTLLTREPSGTSFQTAPSRVPTPSAEEKTILAPTPRDASPAKRAPSPAVTSISSVSVPSKTSVETPNTAKQTLTVFLQLGREVKKATVEPGLSFSSLRMLFLDRFSYNPGLENFPTIYIRDPNSGVQYELEDMEEVQDRCLLSLNIDTLDQIKQHIDTQILTLSRDIKELRTAVSTNKRQSTILKPAPEAPSFLESTPVRPTDKQFQHVARRLSYIVGPGYASETPANSSRSINQALQPQSTGGSVLSEYSGRVVQDLKTQFDEVQNLRRDIGVMRQLYTEFMSQAKESLGTLRVQTQAVKQLASTQVGGARSFIDSGKTNLDNRTQNALTKVEELQDLVEGIKEDVIKRHITPKPAMYKQIKKDMASVSTELEGIKEHIKTIKPMWKKTWGEELQTIVEEQQFLHHQEEFLHDLLEDHKAVAEVYGHVEEVISLQGSAPRSLRGFKPPPAEGNDGLSTVMLEIKGAAVNAEKRMKAIAASEKNREKELASRSDEFQAELNDFIGGKRLKLTGGAEEVERVRQKRNDMTLKAMFNGPSTSQTANDHSGSSSQRSSSTYLPSSA